MGHMIRRSANGSGWAVRAVASWLMIITAYSDHEEADNNRGRGNHISGRASADLLLDGPYNGVQKEQSRAVHTDVISTQVSVVGDDMHRRNPVIEGRTYMKVNPVLVALHPDWPIIPAIQAYREQLSVAAITMPSRASFCEFAFFVLCLLWVASLGGLRGGGPDGGGAGRLDPLEVPGRRRLGASSPPPVGRCFGSRFLSLGLNACLRGLASGALIVSAMLISTRSGLALVQL
jgi:hypothetical protein